MLPVTRQPHPLPHPCKMHLLTYSISKIPASKTSKHHSAPFTPSASASAAGPHPTCCSATSARRAPSGPGLEPVHSPALVLRHASRQSSGPVRRTALPVAGANPHGAPASLWTSPSTLAPSLVCAGAVLAASRSSPSPRRGDGPRHLGTRCRWRGRSGARRAAEIARMGVGGPAVLSVRRRAAHGRGCPKRRCL